jgi:branched-chain amino acid transport system substrate-binding protein
MKRKYLLILISTIAALALIVANIGNRHPSITIGAILPMTGNLSFFGQGNRNALTLFQNINPDTRFEFYDSKGLPKEGLTAARSFSSRRIRYAITSLSYIVNTIQPVFDDAKIANFTLSMDNRAEKKSFYCLRLYPTMQQEMDKLSKIVSERNYKRVLVFYNNVESLSYAVNTYLKSKLPQDAIILSVPYSDSTLDFRDLILKHQSDEPDIIRILDFGNRISTILQQIQETKSFDQTPIVSGVETLLTDYTKFPKDILARYIFTAPRVFLDPENPVVSAYKEKFKANPLFDALLSYDIANLVVPEIRKYGYDNVDKVIQSIIDKKRFSGAAANYAIDSNGGISPELYWAKIINNKIIFADL